jgi:hypothetical protein
MSVDALHAAARRRVPDPAADLLVLIAVAAATNVALRLLVEAMHLAGRRP